ncbi:MULTISPECIES: nucleoside deaminase [unclassified Nocardioides]|uniref:nucleoside deaminase n=1 Tax=unclassified Nocardioides TaxID=2615069 RepID=UPI0030149486
MDDTGLLRHAIAISADAVAHGNHPFGALLASPSGEVLLTAENTVVTERDVTGHAETNLVRLASRTLAPADLAAASLYTSCEPCAMCTGALYWAGIGRLVFAMSEADLREITGAHPDNPTLALPCRDVLAAGSRRTPVEVVGPLIADEAAVHHAGFWG